MGRRKKLNAVSESIRNFISAEKTGCSVKVFAKTSFILDGWKIAYQIEKAASNLLMSNLLNWNPSKDVRQPARLIMTLATRSVQHGVARAKEVIYEQIEALGRHV